MTRGKKIGIAILAAVMILAGLGYYGNSQVNKMIDKLAQSGLMQMETAFSDRGSSSTKNNPTGGPASAAPGNPNVISPAPGTPYYEGSEVVPPDGVTVETVTGPAHAVPTLTPEQNRVLAGAERYVGRKVDRRDVLSAGNIIVNRFSWGEINYLYSVGSNGMGSAQEAHQVRNLLLSRLSGGDIATLTAIGNKYGLSFKILDASFDIDKAYGIKK